MKEALADQQAKAAAELRAAVLEAGSSAGEKMLDRYREGLRDGAMLAAGRAHVNLASSTPDSAMGGAIGGSPAWSL